MAKRRTILLLTILSILVIVAFQVFWLYKNYKEEKRLFTLRTNILFRQSTMKLQASKLHLDTNYNIRIEDKSGVISMTNELQARIHDSLKILPGDSLNAVIMERHPEVMVTMRHDKPGQEDDSLRRVTYRGSSARVLDFLVGVDSLQDSISINEIRDNYEKELRRQDFYTPFNITVKKDNSSRHIFPPDSQDNQVMIGFTHPSVYQLDFINPFWFLIKKIYLQILFSLLLVAITVGSILLLFKNWLQQRRLTELKNDFISNITHELKTPLATVSVAIEALRNFNALEDPRKTGEYLSISANELQRLSLLVDKVLKLSLFEKHEIELKNEPFDLKELVEEVIASMRLQFEKYAASIAFTTSGIDFRLQADKMHITSVIYNLLDNALKYSSANPSVQVEIADLNEWLQLTVTDNGIGIPTEYQDKVFEKFFRVPTGDRHNVKGYGLGLSYSAYVIQRQGGTIEVQSTKGIGSRFNIKIPKNNGQN